MKNAQLKVVPMPEMSEEERFYRKREKQFLTACRAIRQGIRMTGYKGDAVMDLLQGVMGMYAFAFGGIQK